MKQFIPPSDWNIKLRIFPIFVFFSCWIYSYIRNDVKVRTKTRRISSVNWILNILFHIGKVPIHNIDNNKYKYGHWLTLIPIDQVKYSLLWFAIGDPGKSIEWRFCYFYSQNQIPFLFCSCKFHFLF